MHFPHVPRGPAKRSGEAALLCLVLIACACSKENTPSAPEYCENGGYWSQMASPVSSDLDGVWGSARDDVWAVGSNGVILHYDGVEWSLVEHGFASTLDHVQGTSADDVWAAGWEEGETRVYHYDGSTWSRSDPGFNGKIRGMWVAGPDSVWTTGSHLNQGRIWHYDGSGWAAVGNEMDEVRSAWSPSPDTTYFIGSTYSGSEVDPPAYDVVRYDGSSFETMYSLEWTDFNGIFGIDENNIYVVGDTWNEAALDITGLILSGDGTNFSVMDVDPEHEINDLWGNLPENLFAVGDHGTILQRDQSGWRSVDVGIDAQLKGVWGVSGTKAFAVGSAGTILHYTCDPPEEDTDTGPETFDFEELFHYEGTEFYGIWAESPSELYIASTTGVWLVHDEVNADLIWTKSGMYLEGIWGAAGTANVFAVGADSDGALIVHCNGDECQEMEVESPATLVDIHGFSATEVYAVGYNYSGGYPLAFVLQYDGNTWQSMELESDTMLTDIWGAAPDDLWVTGWTFEGDGEVEYGRILHYDGIEWTLAEDCLETDLLNIHGNAQGNIIAVGQNEFAPVLGGSPFGQVMRFDGSQWSEILTQDERGFRAVWVSPNEEIYIGASRWLEVEQKLETEVLRFTGDDFEVLSCQTTDPGDPIEDFWGESDDVLFAITREGSLLRRSDGL